MGSLGYADKKILIIDDENDITNLLEDIILKEGFFNIKKASSGVEGINICRQENPDIVILDIMLPDIDGIEVCKRIREFSYCPILFLSAKNNDIDKILGLSMGGDDYITKPFSPREIVFRIKAQFRRQQYNEMTEKKEELKNNLIKTGRIVIDTDNSQVFKDEKEVKLTKMVPISRTLEKKCLVYRYFLCIILISILEGRYE